MYKNSKYYRFIENDELEELRIVRMQNEEICSAVYVKGPKAGTKSKENIKDIEENYTHLTPDGYLTFSIVKVGKLEDVMATVSTQRGIDAGEKLPFAICRQCANDLFAKQLNADTDCVGLSVSEASCPADIDFANFFACDNLIESEVIEYYIGDLIKDIIPILKYRKKYDETLLDLFNTHCMYLANNNKFIANTYKQREEVDGYCKTLDTLLSLNNFEYDICTAFGIIPTDFEPKHFESGVLSQEAMDTLSKILAVQMYKSLVLKYDRDIDLTKIQRNYTLVADCNNTIYVVAYTTSGKYHVSLEDESEENVEKLNSLLASESTQLAYQHLQFKRGKYK